MDARLRWVYNKTFPHIQENPSIMTRDSIQNDDDARTPGREPAHPDLDYLNAAFAHVDEGVKSGNIASGAAKGLVYSLVETLGALVGDPDLPEHARSGYEGLLEAARELRVKLER
jgi:hypothetical protein